MHRTSNAHTALIDDLRDVKDDLRDELRILVDTVAPHVESAAQGVAQRLPDTVVDRLPDTVVDRLPIKRSHRGRNLLILAGIGALGGVAWIKMRPQPTPRPYDRTESSDLPTPGSEAH